MRVIFRLVLMSLALGVVAPLQAQSVLPDSVMNTVRAAAQGCEVIEVRRITGDTVVVMLMDSTLTQTRWDDAVWSLCGGSRTGSSTRDISRAILKPLWVAWPGMSPARTATLEIRSPSDDSIRMRLSFPPPAESTLRTP